MSDTAFDPRACADPAFVQELAVLIVQSLQLDLDPAQIGPDAPLYGEGLGLDSIDILELALAVSKRYGVQLRTDDADNRTIFASLNNLAAYIAAKRST